MHCEEKETLSGLFDICCIAETQSIQYLSEYFLPCYFTTHNRFYDGCQLEDEERQKAIERFFANVMLE